MPVNVLNINDLLTQTERHRQVLTVSCGSTDRILLRNLGVPLDPPHKLYVLNLVNDAQLKAAADQLLMRCIDAFDKEGHEWRFDRIIMFGRKITKAFGRELGPFESDGTFLHLPRCGGDDPDAFEKASIFIKAFIL